MVTRYICAVLWFIGALAMVLAAVYVWALVIITAIQDVSWSLGLLIILASFFIARQWEAYLLLPWQRWYELWQRLDTDLTRKN